MLKKIASVAASIVALCSIVLITTIATSAAPGNSAWVTLNTSQTYTQSARVQGTYKYFGGTNYSSSAHRVYFDAHFIGQQTNFKDVTANSVLVSPGTSINDVKTKYYSVSGTWYLELNPYGIGIKNCSVQGYIYYS